MCMNVLKNKITQNIRKWSCNFWIYRVLSYRRKSFYSKKRDKIMNPITSQVLLTSSKIYIRRLYINQKIERIFDAIGNKVSTINCASYAFHTIARIHAKIRKDCPFSFFFLFLVLHLIPTHNDKLISAIYSWGRAL